MLFEVSSAVANNPGHPDAPLRVNVYRFIGIGWSVFSIVAHDGPKWLEGYGGGVYLRRLRRRVGGR